MKNLLSVRHAGNTLLIIFSAMVLFHIVVLLGFVPVDMVWGGRVDTREKLVYFELFSIFVTIMAIITVSIKLNYLAWPKLKKTASILMWIIFVLFILNTIGNAFAVTNMERYGAGAVTLILSFLSWRVAVER